jgi:heme A synthase
VLDVLKFLHRADAWLLVGVAFALALWATYCLVRRLNLHRAFRRAWGGLFALTLLQALLGMASFALGGRPQEFLHIVYGLFALALLPVAYFTSQPGPHRDETLIFMISAWIAGVVFLRGIVTG